ncbi:MAG TPA: L,D-transpeptidase [Thermoanaerobaculia bacterium]|jgi:lipoprotein-anchoring transpeptidase ErfK/SrfK|nr:L,D-transpeptidase [Thermoanaerobaculia bacterium]
MKLLSRGLLVLSLVLGVSLSAQTNPTQQPRKCHWWQFGRCDEVEGIEGLPPVAPRTGMVITVDVSTNSLYLFNDGQLVEKSPAATGTEKLLKHRGRVWLFRTPQGHMNVLRKIVDPIWRKPDWAFVEAGEPIPPRDSPKRNVRGHLGKYALDLGDGILIHGTDEARSIGRRASHGCIRLPDEMLKFLYQTVPVGTDVFIFESQMRQASVERHSDLD